MDAWMCYQMIWYNQWCRVPPWSVLANNGVTWMVCYGIIPAQSSRDTIPLHTISLHTITTTYWCRGCATTHPVHRIQYYGIECIITLTGYYYVLPYHGIHRSSSTTSMLRIVLLLHPYLTATPSTRTHPMLRIVLLDVQWGRGYLSTLHTISLCYASTLQGGTYGLCYPVLEEGWSIRTLPQATTRMYHLTTLAHALLAERVCAQGPRPLNTGT